MATIEEIAKAAGASISTVSKALNGYTDISEKTRKRILLVAEQMQYIPNVHARGLALQKPSTPALVFSDVKDTDNNGNIVFRLFISCIHYCQQHGYELLTVHTDSDLQQKKPLSALFGERRIGGAIFYGFKLSDAYIEQMAQMDTPIVLIDMFSPAQNTTTITIDNARAVYDMLSLVVARKRQGRVAVVRGLEDADIDKIRWQAFLEASRALGVTVDTALVRHADYLEDKAYAEAMALYRANPDITCFFCLSDIMAIGVMRALRDLGKRVPEEVAVTGFDGIQISDYVTPSLTTIQQDFKKMGSLASQALIARMGDEPVDKTIYAPYTLRVGGSL